MVVDVHNAVVLVDFNTAIVTEQPCCSGKVLDAMGSPPDASEVSGRVCYIGWPVVLAVLHAGHVIRD